MIIKFSKIGMVVCLSFIISFFVTASSQAQTGTWRTYLGYNEPQQIVKGNNKLYVRASDNLYSYHLNDQSITTYDKIQPLSDTNIKMIAWNPTVKKIIIIYQNFNIDLLDQNDEVFNISSYYNKNTTLDKTVNNIFIHSQFAYIATAFGVIKVDMKREEIAESYILKQNVVNIDISGDSIYVKCNNNGTYSVYGAKQDNNLIDPSNWTLLNTYSSTLFSNKNTDWDDYIEIVKTLKPGGPKYNNFGAIRFKHGQLYTVGGGYSCMAELRLPGLVQIMKDGEWTFLGDSVAQTTGHWFEDVDDVDADPNDPTHIFVGGKTGLYEFRNGQFVGEYTYENSPLTSALGNDHVAAKNYTLVEGLSFDSDGNLWVLNSMTNNYPILQLQKNGQWKTYKPTELLNGNKYLKGLQKIFFDSQNRMWFINYHWEIPSVYCFNPETETFVNKFVSPITNQDGISYEATPLNLKEDLDHNVWLCTNTALFYVDDHQISSGIENVVTQVKVPRNDGTDLADYLLNGAVITAMEVDPAGRKWIATQSNGIYLISADNMTEIEHFTTENSDILSNNIQSLAMNQKNGELFIGTDLGLCSYITNATEVFSSLEKNNVYAFPNPVPSGYNGLITVRGLTLDADIKILSIDGRMVAQGRSNGGTFTWNGRDFSGRKVASGVYMIAIATSDGKSGVVAKVAVVN